jgi:signal transduction histidine kinase
MRAAFGPGGEGRIDMMAWDQWRKIAAGLLWVCGAVCLSLSIPPAAAQTGSAPTESTRAPPAAVLVINSFHDGTPWQHAFNETFAETLTAAAPGMKIFFEHLDAGRLGQPVPAAALARYLSAKYRDAGIGAVVTDSNAAAVLIAGSPDLLPRARRVFVNTSLEPLLRADRGDALLRVPENFRPSITEMLRLADPIRVAIVGDGDRTDRALRLARFREAAAQLLDGRELLDLTNIPFTEALASVAELGAGDAVFYLLSFSDGNGAPQTPYQAAMRLSEASGAPVFTDWASLMGSGIVGGSLLSAERVGDAAARVILDGAEGPLEPDPQTLRRLVYDYDALIRHGLEGVPLPAAAEILNAPASIFETDPGAVGTVMTIGLLLLTLSALLLLLLRQRNQALERSEEQGRRLEERIEAHTAELRRSEALLNATGALAGVGGWELDIPTRSVRWTRETYAIHDLLDRDQPVPLENALDFYPEGAREIVSTAVDRAMRLGEPFDIAVEFVTAKGRRLWTRSICQPEMADGKVVRLRGAFQDITERKATETALLQARRQAEEANAAKSRFLAAMSHDLRTPLNAILGFSDMMRQRVFGRIGDARYEGYVEDIHASGEMLISLINDVLDLSKIEAGKYELSETVLDVAALCETGRRQIDPMAREASVSVGVSVSETLPRLRGDSRALMQILNNLLSNAVKFTPAGGTVTLFARTNADGGIALGVTDTGIGMTPEDIERALAPYEQVDPQVSRRHEGTGLGLYLCLNLMQLFHGRLDIASTPGDGTTVTCSFPPERSMPPF